MFGGVYAWAAFTLAMGVSLLALVVVPSPPADRWARILDLSLVAVLAGIALQLVPLPAPAVSLLTPARDAYVRAVALQADSPPLVPLTLRYGATGHALVAFYCTIVTFWIARTLFSRGGLRRTVTGISAIAIVFVLVAVAQHAADPTLAYGFWQPYDAGARPLGPFVNRNHGGTWSVIAVMLCLGCFQWRRASAAPSRGWSWQDRLAHELNGRSLLLVVAIVLLTLNIALGASRSTSVGLAGAACFFLCGSLHVRGPGSHRRGLWILIVAAALALVSYANIDPLLSRIGETRRLGLGARAAIWSDTLGIVRDFPVAGVGAGNLATAMLVYQTTDRTYFWNEAHNAYLQVAAEGGLLLALPAATALVALGVCGWRQIRHRDDPVRWLRLGAAAALFGAAIQAVWETGLMLPANGMLAAVAAAILVHRGRTRTKHVSPTPSRHGDN